MSDLLTSVRYVRKKYLIFNFELIGNFKKKFTVINYKTASNEKKGHNKSLQKVTVIEKYYYYVFTLF